MKSNFYSYELPAGSLTYADRQCAAKMGLYVVCGEFQVFLLGTKKSIEYYLLNYVGVEIVEEYLRSEA